MVRFIDRVSSGEEDLWAFKERTHLGLKTCSIYWTNICINFFKYVVKMTTISSAICARFSIWFSSSMWGKFWIYTINSKFMVFIFSKSMVDIQKSWVRIFLTRTFKNNYIRSCPYQRYGGANRIFGPNSSEITGDFRKHSKNRAFRRGSSDKKVRKIQTIRRMRWGVMV